MAWCCSQDANGRRQIATGGPCTGQQQPNPSPSIRNQRSDQLCPALMPTAHRCHPQPPLLPLPLQCGVHQCGQGSRCSCSASARQGAYRCFRVIAASMLVLLMTHTCRGCMHVEQGGPVLQHNAALPLDSAEQPLEGHRHLPLRLLVQSLETSSVAALQEATHEFITPGRNAPAGDYEVTSLFIQRGASWQNACM